MQDNIFLNFRKIVNQKGESPALFFKKNNEYQYLSYKNLYEKAITLGNLLLKKGINPQDKVAILLENNPFWPISFMGIMYTKAVAVPLNYLASDEELNYLLTHSESKILLTTFNLYSKAKKIIKNLDCQIIILEEDLFEKELDTEINMDFSDIEKDKVALLVYTSGTTRTPKGVMLTHHNLLSNMRSLLKLNILKPTDCFISVLPLYHSYPFLTNLLLPLLSGAKVSCPSQLEAEAILECIQKTGVTIFVGVPRLFSLFHEKISLQLKKHPLWFLINPLLNIFLPLRKWNINLAKILLSPLHKKFSKVRLFISGGAKLDIKVAKDFYRWGFTLLEGYGLTEASPVVSFNLPHKFKFGSVGLPIPGVEVKIKNPQNQRWGEILVKGENIMLGYYKEEDLTKEVIKDGWLHTKDLGFIDKQGFLFIQGRSNETITLSSGKKINPEEIEALYLRSPFIKEICILLPEKIERLSAVIFPDYEYFKSQKVTQIKEKIRWEIENISKKLPPYQRIHQYVITSEPLPKTTLGKLKRFQIEEKFYTLFESSQKLKRELPQDKEILSHPLCQKALTYLSQKLKREIHLDDHLELDLGLDSLEQIELFLGFQKATGIKISDEDALGIFTVRDALRKLYELSIQKKLPSQAVSTQWEEILSQIPPEVKRLIPLKQNFLEKMVNFILSLFLIILTKVFFLLKVEGKNNLPREGPYILCPNHNSYLDGLIVASSCSPFLVQKIYFLGYSKYFKHPLLRPFVKLFRLISIDPVLQLIESMQACSYILKNSKILCLFPEGARSPDGKIQSFKKGIGILVKELGVDVLPVYIKGTYEAWSRYRLFPRPYRVKIVFGKKISAYELIEKDLETQELYQIIAEKLRDKLIQLSENV
ncbi:MAG: hypothetical protein B6D55_02895 [Candidatus Omnitrophica bacterium 4484_70.2]|nr:MAG: hypothetical protein B6D55_02895 [Candidatus Omnitrophica bacterium 4484_70.2]